jgi:hypothetical protein
MTDEKILAGQTYFIEIPNAARPHFFFVVIDQDPVTGRVIIVPIDHENLDNCRTVEFKVGEYDFVTKHSYVTYSFAIIVESDLIRKRIKNMTAKRKSDISKEKIQEIQEKMTSSGHVKDEVRDFYRTQTWKL